MTGRRSPNEISYWMGLFSQSLMLRLLHHTGFSMRLRHNLFEQAYKWKTWMGMSFWEAVIRLSNQHYRDPDQISTLPWSSAGYPQPNLSYRVIVKVKDRRGETCLLSQGLWGRYLPSTQTNRQMPAKPMLSTGEYNISQVYFRLIWSLPFSKAFVAYLTM